MSLAENPDVIESVTLSFDEPGLKFADPWGIGGDAAPGDPCGGRAVCPGDPCGGRAVCPGDPRGEFGANFQTTSEFLIRVLGEIPASDLSVEQLIHARLSALRAA